MAFNILTAAIFLNAVSYIKSLYCINNVPFFIYYTHNWYTAVSHNETF